MYLKSIVFVSSFNCFIASCDIIITVSYPCSEYEHLKMIKTLIYEVSSSVLNVTEPPFVDLYAYKKYPAGNAGHEITFFFGNKIDMCRNRTNFPHHSSNLF